MANRLISRKISVFRPLMDSLRQPLPPNKAGAEGKMSDTWKYIFKFVCVPAIILCGINVYLSEEHHRPEFIPYEHLRIRNKPFPWGDGKHTLFHNSYSNALPNGYET